MTFEETLRFMQTHPWNFYYLDPSPTSVKLGENFMYDYEVPELFSDEEKHDYEQRREKLDEIGSKICIMPLPSGWEGIGQYNYAHVDDILSKLLKGHPDRWFIPRVHLNAPTDWMREHPEELCVYGCGPRDVEGIRALVGTPEHDMWGFNNGKISRQSFSSRLWLKDALVAWEHLIRHLEESPYGKQVLAYMPQFGNCGENMWFGDWRVNKKDDRWGDFGISHTRLFFEWALEKYGSLEEVRKAWKSPNLTAENMEMPTIAERFGNDKTLKGALLVDDQKSVDSNEFHSKCCMDALEAFGKMVKEMTGKPCGSFYGYLQDDTVGYAGHTAFDRALTTPYLDFYSSPKGYHYCQAGDPGTSQAPGQSIARKKLWIEENDMRSYHMHETHPKDTYSPKTFEETYTCFWRELYRALTLKQGFWWMDINGMNDDWYGDPKMVEMLHAQADFYKKWSIVPRKDITEVLFVEDEKSYEHMGIISGISWSVRLRLDRELRLCGTPVDRFRLADLFEMDLSQYKFIVFTHSFLMPKEKWQILEKRIRPDAHIVWNYGAALLTPAFDPNNQKAVTGFNTIETPGRMQPESIYRHIYWHSTREIPNDYPLLSIVPEAGQEVLQTSPDHHILTARVPRGKGASIQAVDRTLRSDILRRLMADAGVHFQAPENCAVLADEKLIGFFPRWDVDFSYFFDGRWRNVITGEEVGGSVELKIQGKKFAIFEKVDEN